MKYLIALALNLSFSLLYSQKYTRALEVDSIHTITIFGDSMLSRYQILSHSIHSKEPGNNTKCIIDTLYDNLTNKAFAPTILTSYKLYKSKYFITVTATHFSYNIVIYEFNGNEWNFIRRHDLSLDPQYYAKFIFKEDMSIEINSHFSNYLLQFKPETKSFKEEKITTEKH